MNAAYATLLSSDELKGGGVADDDRPTHEPTSRARLASVADGDTVEARVLDRLSEYLDYYEARSRTNQRWYRILKIAQLVAAALIPVVVSVNVSGWVTGGLGSLVVVVEGIQQLYQFQELWLAYRSTAEALRREQHLYQIRAGDYATSGDAPRVLAERVEALLNQEHARWTTAQAAARQQPPAAR